VGGFGAGDAASQDQMLGVTSHIDVVSGKQTYGSAIRILGGRIPRKGYGLFVLRGFRTPDEGDSREQCGDQRISGDRGVPDWLPVSGMHRPSILSALGQGLPAQT
jgi:hypothetical protein